MADGKHIERGSRTEGTPSSINYVEPIDPEAEKRLLRKCDRHVLPACTVLFFLAFMDRTNIGSSTPSTPRAKGRA